MSSTNSTVINFGPPDCDEANPGTPSAGIGIGGDSQEESDKVNVKEHCTNAQPVTVVTAPAAAATTSSPVNISASSLGSLKFSISTILAVPPPTTRCGVNGANNNCQPQALTVHTVIEDCNQENGSASDGASTVSDSESSRSNSPTMPDLENQEQELKPPETANIMGKRSIRNRTGKNKSASTSTTSSASSNGKRKRASVTNPKIKKRHNYKHACSAKEDHGQPIFGCAFRHQRCESDPLILATVGSNRISFYECLSDGKLKMVQVFADPDTDEEFYSCAWTEDDTGKSLLAAAGARAVIRIISPYHAACVKHYLGHGQSINDLSFHPKDPNLLLAASKDHSLRLYNIKTDYLVAVFGGVDGHRDEVLGADIDITGSRIVSCGMDHSLKVWKLNKPEVEQAIASSYTYKPKSSNSNPFPTTKQNFPDFSTRDIHRNYVDCTKWFGDFILSKSCENSIICWKAGNPGGSWDDVRITTAETSFIHRFEIRDCEIWFLRFSMDYWKKVLALGNQYGKAYIYDLSLDSPSSKPSNILSHPKCTSPIRQTALSRDGRVLVCVCDDSTIWRWDLHEGVDIGAGTTGGGGSD